MAHETASPRTATTPGVLSRRDLLGRATVMVGGAIALRALPGCGKDDPLTCPPPQTCPPPESCPPPETCPPPPEPGAQVADFPYQQHLAAGYQLDAAAIREQAYHDYYAGGCCHAVFHSMLSHLAQTVGQPFTLLPPDFGKFGAGGVAGYGSICGSLLGSVLITNLIVADAAKRGALMTGILRWYEGNAFPAYDPTTIDAAETGLLLDFSAGNLSTLQVVPGSHLCHASVSTWCASNGVSAASADKKARCARLSAGVAGKTAELLNAYLATGAYTAPIIDSVSASCLECHGPTITTFPVASGMACSSCHSDKLSGHPAL